MHHAAWLSRYLGAEEIRALKVAEGAGCTYCNMTGYRGRVGVYELLEVDAPIADAIRRSDLTGVEQLAAKLPHFVPLVRGALQLAIDRVTSLDEIMKSTSGLEEPGRRRNAARRRAEQRERRRRRGGRSPRELGRRWRSSVTTDVPRAARP